MQKTFLAAIALCTTAGLANAQNSESSATLNNGWRVDANLASANITGGNYASNPILFGVLLSKELKENLAVETMLTTTAGHKSASFSEGVASSGNTVSGTFIRDVKMTTVGAYLTPRMNWKDNSVIYARLGVAYAQFNAENGTGTSSAGGSPIAMKDSTTSGTSFSWGIGGRAMTSKNTTFSTDFVSYYNKDGVQVNGISFGFGQTF